MSVRRAVFNQVAGAAHGLGAFRLLHRWMLPEAVSVLMYHGLVRSPLLVRDACFVSLDQFTRQMEYLSRHFHVMHLEEALAPGRPRSKRPVACVTFDDGLASIHDLAFPVLERLSIPATAYLVTDLVDSVGTVWYARLHRAICETSAPEVRLQELRFRLTDLEARAAASGALQRMLKKLARPDFTTAFEDLLDQLGSSGSRPVEPGDPFRILSSGEIRRMGRDDRVRFGGHTTSHQILTRTTREDARREIECSIAAINALVERPSRTFAYPNGGDDDFDAEAIEVIKSARIDYGVTTIGGPNWADTDPYRIHRYAIGAAHPLARFAGMVHHTRHGLRALAGRSGVPSRER